MQSVFTNFDILTSFKGEAHAYSLSTDTPKNIIEKEAEDTINQLMDKKNIISSINISVISVEFSKAKPRDLQISGKTKNLKHAAVEIGLPGSPKKHLLFTNLAKRNGLPGLIATPLKIFYITADQEEYLRMFQPHY